MIIGRNFIFVLVPKNASTSILAALHPFGRVTGERHDWLTEKPAQPIVAAVWRDEPDRAESARHYGRGEDFPVRAGLGFRDVPQEQWFQYVNHRLRFERLADDWRRFCDAVDVDQPLPHLNKRVKYAA